MTSAPEPQAPARGAFLRAVMVLVGGTALAHGLSAAALPVLSRLYSPTDFGLLAVFSGSLSIIAVAACLRYDVAVALPERDDDAMHLLALALACALGITAVLALAVGLAPAWIAARLGQPALAPYLWLMPIGVLAAGCYAALQTWQVRKKQFTRLARTRVAQSAASVGMQIGLGTLAVGAVGLLAGYVLNAGVACLALGGDLLRALRGLSIARIGALAHEYRRFPKFSTLEALANAAAIQLPIIMVAALAAPAEAGYLAMAMYAMQVPMALVGTAISQVYLSRAPEEHRNGRLGAFTAEMLRGLLKAGIGPLLAAGILSPLLFGLILGPRWERAGWLVSWMVPWFAMQFLASPISMALHVTGHQRRAFMLQLVSLIVRVAAVALASGIAPAVIGEAYALSGFVVYLAYLLVVLVTIEVPLGVVLARPAPVVGVITGWVAAASAIAIALAMSGVAA